MINSKIGFKLTFGVVVTLLVVISIYAYFNIQSETKTLLMEVERHATQFSEHLKSDMGYDMLHNDRVRIQDSISRIGSQGAINGIRVFNKDGEVIYSSIPKEIGKMVTMQATSCYRCHLTGQPIKKLQRQEHMRIYRPDPDGPRLLGIINPVYNEPSCWTSTCHAHPETKTVLGVLDVTMPLDKVDENIRRSQIAIVVLTFSVIILLSLIIGFLVRWWIDR